VPLTASPSLYGWKPPTNIASAAGRAECDDDDDDEDDEVELCAALYSTAALPDAVQFSVISCHPWLSHVKMIYKTLAVSRYRREKIE
jgi:hypothetical protein